MAPVAGYNATVQIGGTSTAMTAEPTTDVGGAHTSYQITDASKRCLDPAVAVVVDSNGTPVSATLYTLDYYTGKVTFASARGAGETITFDASYIPLLTVATARKASLKLSRDSLDVTRFGTASGYRTKTQGVATCSGSLDVIEDLLEDHDAGAGTVKFWTLIRAGTLTLLTVKPGSAGKTLRTWALLSGNEDADVAGLLSGGVQWESAGYHGAAASWSWDT